MTTSTWGSCVAVVPPICLQKGRINIQNVFNSKASTWCLLASRLLCSTVSWDQISWTKYKLFWCFKQHPSYPLKTIDLRNHRGRLRSLVSNMLPSQLVRKSCSCRFLSTRITVRRYFLIWLAWSCAELNFCRVWSKDSISRIQKAELKEQVFPCLKKKHMFTLKGREEHCRWQVNTTHAAFIWNS